MLELIFSLGINAVSFAADTHAGKANRLSYKGVCGHGDAHRDSVIALLRSFSTSKAEIPPRGHPSHPVTVAHRRDPEAPTWLLSPQSAGGRSAIAFSHTSITGDQRCGHTLVSLIQDHKDFYKLAVTHTNLSRIALVADCIAVTLLVKRGVKKKKACQRRRGLF